MRLKSFPLAILVFIILFGGIAFTSAMNWWQTESTKIPARYSDGTAAGQFNPADIRGSYTFGDVTKNFGIPLDDLRAAFRLPEYGDTAAFQVKSMEGLYSGLPVEMGTGAVRLFTAFYLGLPFDLAANADTYLFPEAAAILNASGKMTADQAEFLKAHTLTNEMDKPVDSIPVESSLLTPTPVPAATEHTAAAGTITGKTTFQQLMDMGVSADVIQTVIGEPLADTNMTIKDYAAAKGQEFSTLKTTLQTRLDEVNPK